jgi:hypothetical protein
MSERAPLYSSAALALDIMAIAESPLFAFQAHLAHELGLLARLIHKGCGFGLADIA